MLLADDKDCTLQTGSERNFPSLWNALQSMTQHTASPPTVRASEGATPPQEFDMMWASSEMQ